MSLRVKIVLGLLAVALLYAGLDNGLHRSLSGKVFGRWEAREAEESLERARCAFDTERDALRALARTWAARSEVADLLAGQRSALDPRVLEDAGIDLYYVCDARGEDLGKVLWQRAVDPDTGEPAPVTRDLPRGALSPGHPLLNFERDESDRSGLMMTDGLPLLVVSCPVRVGDATDAPAGPFREDDAAGEVQFRRAAHGYVILGRFVGRSFVERVRRQAGVDLSIRELEAGPTGGEERELLAGLTAGERRAVSREGADGRLHVYSTITDMRSLRPLVFQASLERRISAYGERVVNYALLSSVVSVLLFVFVLMLLLQGIVLRPLSTLTQKAVEIGKTDDSTIRVGLERSDEIGTLATEFDSMLEKLALSRAQLVKTARLAGMSEIATGVLHNVGNVLNSVNVSASLLKGGIDRLSTKDLERFVGVLEEASDDLARFISEDPRGKHTVPFLRELVDSFAEKRQEVRAEVAAVLEGVDHISDLVRSQQTYAGAKGVFELASLEAELEAALKICTQADGTLAGLEVVREYAELPSVPVDKHKLMEILVNLIQNASQAMRRAETRRLTLRILEPEPGTARIEVEDTGTGIERENLERVFHHGFTTKENGHGFGLHTSANAATEMNGSLRARSEGAGRGAVFHLDLPMSKRETASAA